MYRIENSEKQAWDSVDNRWRSIFDGRYSTYKSTRQAIASARRIKNIMFQAYSTKVVEDVRP